MIKINAELVWQGGGSKIYQNMFKTQRKESHFFVSLKNKTHKSV